ncbi:MAG: hypothetical protein FWD57_07155 [Polyangiaceae bacterium]|nr:hypothetical protein [Polyangiaceae bacterium]
MRTHILSHTLETTSIPKLVTTSYVGQEANTVNSKEQESSRRPSARLQKTRRPSPAPDGMHALDLVHPALHDVRGIAVQGFRGVEEAWSGLRVSQSEGV